MTTFTLTLPLLTGTHRDALRLITAAALPADLTNVDVHVDAGATLAGTDAFAAELVRTLLLNRSAARLIIHNVGTRLGHQLYTAAKHHQVAHRLLIHFGAFQPPT